MARTTSGVATRVMAAQLVDAVLSTGRNLDVAIAAADMQALSERDRAFVKSLCFGTLRTHTRNQLILAQLLSKPLRGRDQVVVALLSTALHALIDNEAAEYATVSATVDAVVKLGRPKMRGLVNALLRRYLREAPELLAQAREQPAGRWQHPEWFVERVRSDWPDAWQNILSAANQQPPMWLRVNLARTSRTEWQQQLPAEATLPGPLPTSVQVLAPVPVSELPGFADGACSVQDAASQLATHLLDARAGMRVLDACAAPGGKTGHILEQAQVELVALDSSAQRLERVRENLQRLQLQAEVVTGDALQPDAWWDGQLFDRILLDSPCSATGVMRRHPDIRFLRRPGDIAAFAQTQRALLEALWPLLRPGGRLLYSTCSIMPVENTDVAADFIAVHPEARVVPVLERVPFAGAVAVEPGVQLLPGSDNTDGFYYVLIERV